MPNFVMQFSETRCTRRTHHMRQMELLAE